MSIKLGNSNITLKVGSSAVTAAYLGSTQVYPQGEPPALKYKLTLNNGTVVTGECDGTSALTYNEVSIKYNNLVSAEIYDCVKSIGYACFSGCRNLTDITIPNSIISIGDNAFINCFGLPSITIPTSVTSIGSNSFRGCSGFTDIAIPSSLVSIGSNAFYGCSGLSGITVDSNNTVYDSRNNCNAIIETSTNKLIRGCNSTVIPSSVTSIGERAFNRCSGLIDIIIPNSVSSIGSGVFENCTNLSSCTLGSGVTIISNSCFSNCPSLADIAIPSGVTSIGEDSFGGCTNLTDITIPSGVTSIGYSAFYGCSGLTGITVNATTPPSLGEEAFSNTNDCPIYVPCESVEAYKAASGWSTYADRIQAIP